MKGLLIIFEKPASSGIGAFLLFILILWICSRCYEPTEVVTPSPLPEVFESTYFEDDARKVGTFSDKQGNSYSNTLFIKYGSANDCEIYRLDGQYTSFECTVFVPTERTNKTETSRVSIYGDGKQLWASSHMGIDSPAESCCINVSGVQELEIRYEGGASTWPMPIGIGNISLGTDPVDTPPPSQTSMRLLDVPMKESTFICRYTHRPEEDHYGNTYSDVVYFNFGRETDKDIYLLEGKYSSLSGTIFVPSDRSFKTEDDPAEMYYIKFYGDGKLLYTSPRMTGMQKPCDFNIDVSGVQELTMTYYGGAITWDRPIGLADLLLK